MLTEKEKKFIKEGAKDVFKQLRACEDCRPLSNQQLIEMVILGWIGAGCPVYHGTYNPNKEVIEEGKEVIRLALSD